MEHGLRKVTKNKWIQNIGEKIIFKLILESKQNVLKVNICLKILKLEKIIRVKKEFIKNGTYNLTNYIFIDPSKRVKYANIYKLKEG